ncbi:MAG TPA: dienelactone hydrolase family protein [Candidatus Sulfopaludibacter sp.]|jgi:carboxymethylenebutenolidase|nr:dienelactone hydrolase family protein [Candidatus Sulfopaludibacter sp.]
MRLTLFATALCLAMACHAASIAETVHFRSADGATELTGYLFRPAGSGPHPAIVMLHGRQGPFSTLAKGVYNANTLTKRHKFWGQFWSERGYVALLVDSFGPRGFWTGFPKASYADRPSEVSEQTVRPLDAYGALAYLKKRSDVAQDRIGLQGWSNGGMTALVTMSTNAPGNGFRAALSFYPGCAMAAIQTGYKPYAPVQMFVGTADAEVSAKRCQNWEKKVEDAGGTIALVAYEGAEHDFDDPSTSRQGVEANATATRDATKRAEEFFARHLR